MDSNLLTLLRFMVCRDITVLYKQYLNQLEDLKQDRLEALRKLQKSLPPDYYNMVLAADFMNENKASYLRKKILDSGNDALRNIKELIEKFEKI